ncbi:MAG TPA: four helix bundle protein [Verrucomicrobiae bacterium]|nr:four helix bundle protein [Verrucomicrobiae bacterium]
MNYENLKERTQRFALNVIKITERLPKDLTSRVLGTQLLRSGTAVGANYRAVCRAKSNADFIAKFGTVEEEADESGYWLELLVASGKLEPDPAAALLRGSNELTAIAVSSIRTARVSGGRRSAECGARNVESRDGGTRVMRIAAWRSFGSYEI